MSCKKQDGPMGARTMLRLGALLIASVGPSLAEPVTSAPDPQHGGQLAQRLCSNCHLVSDEQSKALAYVPTFKEIANRPGQTAGTIVARIVIPKHPMPVIPIAKSELNDLASYIMSLRDPVE